MLKFSIESPTLNKSDLDNLAYSFIEPVLEGNINPIEQWVQVKALADVCERFLKDENIKSAVLSDIEKHGKGGATYNGVKIETSNRSELNYSECNDPVYNDLKAELEKLTAKVKERETFLKSVPYAGLEITIEATGEMVKVYAPQKVNTTSPKVTFAK